MEQMSLFGEPVPIETKLRPQIDLNALYAYAKEQAKIHWDREFDIPIELVKYRWKSTDGMYLHYSSEIDKKWIRMSLERNKHRTWEQVKGTLLHELVHWHMHTTGQPFSDSDVEFAQECLRVGAPLSGTQIAKKAGKIAEKLNKERFKWSEHTSKRG